MSIYDRVKEDPEWKPLSEGSTKLYVLVRGDLSRSQQAVQACHAVAQFCITMNETHSSHDDTHNILWPNEHLVLLRVRHHEHLVILREKIRALNEIWCEFKEPYYDNQTTAVAAWESPELKELLKDLPLL